MQTIKKLFFLLTLNERKRAGLLMLLATIMALLDMIGIASILPFVGVLTNPGLIETNTILKSLFQVSSNFGVKTDREFLLFTGALVFVLLITSLIFKTFVTYLQIRFVSMREYSIGRRLVDSYLRQPYSWFLSHHSADLGKNILSEVRDLISYGINPLIQLIVQSIVTITLIALLIVYDPKLSLIIGMTFSFAYLLVYFFVRKFLSSSGEERLKNNQLRFKSVNEAFSASKEIKIRNLEEVYIKIFSNSAQKYAKTISWYFTT